jgi:hypothetical protein
MYGISSTQKIQDVTVSQMFLNSEGVIHVDFLPHGVTVNAQNHSNLLHNDMHQVIWKKRHRKLSKKIVLLHDNTHPHGRLTKVTDGNKGCEIMNHIPSCPE